MGQVPECTIKMVSMNFGKMRWTYNKRDNVELTGERLCENVATASPRVDVVRRGREVVINGVKGTHVIPADAVVGGFGEGKDGRMLYQIMANGVPCNYFLDPENSSKRS